MTLSETHSKVVLLSLNKFATEGRRLQHTDTTQIFYNCFEVKKFFIDHLKQWKVVKNYVFQIAIYPYHQISSRQSNSKVSSHWYCTADEIHPHTHQPSWRAKQKITQHPPRPHLTATLHRRPLQPRVWLVKHFLFSSLSLKYLSYLCSSNSL